MDIVCVKKGGVYVRRALLNRWDDEFIGENLVSKLHITNLSPQSFVSGSVCTMKVIRGSDEWILKVRVLDDSYCWVLVQEISRVVIPAKRRHFITNGENKALDDLYKSLSEPEVKVDFSGCETKRESSGGVFAFVFTALMASILFLVT